MDICESFVVLGRLFYTVSVELNLLKLINAFLLKICSCLEIIFIFFKKLFLIP